MVQPRISVVTLGGDRPELTVPDIATVPGHRPSNTAVGSTSCKRDSELNRGAHFTH